MDNSITKIYIFISTFIKMKFLIIKFIHRLIRKISLSKILVLSYPIGLVYYFLTPRSNMKLNKRKKNITNYSPLLVKINYVKYWIETIWLSKEGYDSQILQDVEIINEDEVKKLNRNFDSFIIALPHVGNWEFAIPMGKPLNLKLLAVAEPLSDINILKWFTDLRESLGCLLYTSDAADD